MVVCMAAPISPRLRRNREKPVSGLEPHGKIRRRRITRSESLETRPTKKIPKELALAMGHGLTGNDEQEVPLEERIKAIVHGNRKELPSNHIVNQEMKNLMCSSVDFDEWLCESFRDKTTVRGSNSVRRVSRVEDVALTKGANSERGENSGPKTSDRERRIPSQTPKKDMEIKNRKHSQPPHEQQLYNRSQTSLSKSGSTQQSICKSESRHTGRQSSSHAKTPAQASANSYQRRSSDTAGLASNSADNKGMSRAKMFSNDRLQRNTNITDSEKILHKLRSSSIVRHKSLYSPPCDNTMLLPHPESERGRSDDVLVRSPRSKSETRMLEKNSCDPPENLNFNEDQVGLNGSTYNRKSGTTVNDKEQDGDKMEKPKSPGSPNKIVRKKSTLSRNKTDLFRTAKEHPSSISRLKEKFAKFSAAAYQRKLSNQLSVMRKKKKEASEPSVRHSEMLSPDKDSENSVLQSAKELQSCRVAECPSDTKSYHSHTPCDLKSNHSRTPSREHQSAIEFQKNCKVAESHIRSNHSGASNNGEPHHSRSSSKGEPHSRTSSKGEPHHSRTSIKGEPHHSRSSSKGETTSEAHRKTSQTSSESGGSGPLVVRQCLIGTNLAFGLVQLNAGPNGNSHSDGHGLVTIRMRPDDQGRFGFNVKGGADQGMPIIVSRVAPGTPADLAIPRLNEGDQVLFINGRDVSQHTHEQVVMFIRASRETHSGELVLIVRPNVYVGEEAQEEQNLEYLPENYQIIAPGAGTGTNALEASLMLLQESLDSGAALAQFEQLYRKKPGMTMNAARLDVNIAKNRYRDISPYDQTRVILKEQNVSGGDYINANYVNMEIPGSGIVNRYIAAQGPLPKTCTDFWQMVWEQHSSLVVMLTTKVEKGRVKCHQYWPEMYETMDYGLLQITCVKEEETPSFAFREFNLTHAETNEERHISHMQYIAWPDHNVPDDPADFLEFVLRVRQRRMGMVEPTVVHCSAGIGRTGVLITMETAMCLIEANQPVYPLSIVRQMRDQRAMLIQTATQYKFVCEAILKVYNEELVKPLEDYQR